ncbi:MAG TPA: LysM domain-containing protein [Blastocatellia bacterium]|jgi:hypothetical protein
MFEPTSRYFAIETAVYTAPGGREIAYIRRRFLPDTSSEPTLAEHTVVQGERLDHITARYVADPELFWRICDTNYAMKPEDLTAEVGRRLRISFPQS